MTAFERRLAKVEAERTPEPQEGLRVRLWTSPEGMTDLVEQKAWLAAQVAADPEQVPGLTLNVHFVHPASSDPVSATLH